MDFPQFVSFTVTNSCNLRCAMCGQWSDEGYIYNHTIDTRSEMELEDWKKLVDEAASNNIKTIIIRGGEPFLFPGIIKLLEYINSKGIFISIDSNGTLLKKYAEDIIRIGNMHITFSVDGPEEIHDSVRGVKGSFKKMKENIALLNELEKKSGRKISKSACFTISKFSYRGLGEMPNVVRDLELTSINIVPYYYVPSEIGKKYEDELEKNFNCKAFSWKGFHHEDSGIDFNLFNEEYKKYLASLDGINDYPYMPLTEDEYRSWFNDSLTPVGSLTCTNVERLIDIQPNGNANFCVDFPDYSFGNAKLSSIKEMWNSPMAAQFRDFRRENPLSVCYRCGAQHMSKIRE